MDDSLVITCSVDEQAADPPTSPFNRIFLADENACKQIIPLFRENRFPTAWVIWNRSANHSKLVIYRTEYLMRDGPIKITPTFAHPGVICEVLSETKSERSPIGRTLIAS